MKKELIAHKDPKSPVSEVFRTLRTNIQFMSSSSRLNTLLVTSTFPGEGKSWVTSNLAVTFAQTGKRIILIDADMRKGRQFNIFGVSPRPGLSNYLSNIDADNMETTDTDVEDYIQTTDVENLHVISSGNVPPNPSELLVSSRMVDLLKELKTMYDLIIIDGTPCDLVTDSVILSRIVDATIIVTAHKETKKDNLQRIVKNIQNVGGKIAGIVVNKIPVAAKKYSESYYYGSIASSENRNSTKKKDRERSIDRQKQRQFDRHTSENKEKITTTSEKHYTANKAHSVKAMSENNMYKHNHSQEKNVSTIKVEKPSEISIDKAKEILKQVNEYIDTEKANFNKEKK